MCANIISKQYACNTEHWQPIWNFPGNYSFSISMKLYKWPSITTEIPAQLFPSAANLRTHNTIWCNYQLHPNVNSNLRALILQYWPRISHPSNLLPAQWETSTFSYNYTWVAARFRDFSFWKTVTVYNHHNRPCNAMKALKVCMQIVLVIYPLKRKKCQSYDNPSFN